MCAAKWAAFFPSRQEVLATMHRVWVATRDWKRHFEQWDASEHNMRHLEGAIRRLSDLASPQLEAELHAFAPH